MKAVKLVFGVGAEPGVFVVGDETAPIDSAERCFR